MNGYEAPEPFLAIGDSVTKRTGYPFPGIVRSVFTTKRGVIRCVVEADHEAFAGMLHIFDPGQLVRR